MERDLGHPKRLGDLLDTHALSCHLLDGEKFLCRAHRCARTMIVNTSFLRQMWLWCIDWCHESVLCVDVKCAKVCCFESYFFYVEHFSSKGTQNKHEHFLFWASHLHTTIPRNKNFQKNANDNEHRGPKRKKAKASLPPCILFLWKRGIHDVMSMCAVYMV